MGKHINIFRKRRNIDNIFIKYIDTALVRRVQRVPEASFWNCPIYPILDSCPLTVQYIFWQMKCRIYWMITWGKSPFVIGQLVYSGLYIYIYIYMCITALCFYQFSSWLKLSTLHCHVPWMLFDSLIRILISHTLTLGASAVLTSWACCCVGIGMVLLENRIAVSTNKEIAELDT